MPHYTDHIGQFASQKGYNLTAGGYRRPDGTPMPLKEVQSLAATKGLDEQSYAKQAKLTYHQATYFNGTDTKTPRQMAAMARIPMTDAGVPRKQKL